MAIQLAADWGWGSAAPNGCATNSWSKPHPVRAPSSPWRVGGDMDTRIVDPSQVSEGRRLAVEFARRTGADDGKLARIALIATEMATNLIKHGAGGILVVVRFVDAVGSGIELMALDQGGGMADVGRSLVDGYSTAGSPGTGLGAIGRQSDRLAVFSRPGLGTVVMARLIFAPAAKLS